MPAFRGPDRKVVYVPDDEADRYRAGGEYQEVGRAEAGAAQSKIAPTDNGVLGSIGATISGGLSGATLGASDWLLKGVLNKGQFEQLAQDRADNPILAGTAQAAGMALPALVTGGAATPAGALGRLAAEGIETGRAAGGALGVAQQLGAAGAEGAIANAGIYLSDVALGDRNLTAEGINGALGTGLLFGAAGIPVTHGIEAGTIAARRMFARYAEGGAGAADAAAAAWTEKAQKHLEGFDQAAELAKAKLAETQTAREAANLQRLRAGSEMADARAFTPPSEFPGGSAGSAAVPSGSGAVAAGPAGGAGGAGAATEAAAAEAPEVAMARALRDRAKNLGGEPITPGEIPPGSPGFRRSYVVPGESPPAGPNPLEQLAQQPGVTMQGPATLARSRRIVGPPVTADEAELGARLGEYQAARRSFDELHAQVDPDLDAVLRGVQPGDVQRPPVPVGEFGEPGVGGFKSQNELGRLAAGTGREEGEQVARASADVTGAGGPRALRGGAMGTPAGTPEIPAPAAEPGLAADTIARHQAGVSGAFEGGLSENAGGHPQLSIDAQRQVRGEMSGLAEKYGLHHRLADADYGDSILIAHPGESNPDLRMAFDHIPGQLHNEDSNFPGLVSMTPDQARLLAEHAKLGPTELRALGQKAAGGDEAAVDSVFAGHVMNHETIHGFGPRIEPDQHKSIIEELTTELAARRITGDVHGVQSHTVGTFAHIVDPAVDAIAKASGASKAEAYSALERSALDFKRRSGTMSSDQAIHDVMGGALRHLGNEDPAALQSSTQAVYKTSREVGVHPAPVADVPEYAAIKAHEAKADDYLEQTLPARKIADRGYYEPPGGGEDPVRVANARKAIADGQREAIKLGVTPTGKIVLSEGSHRLAAAVDSDAPIKVKWFSSHEPASHDVLRGASRARPAMDIANYDAYRESFLATLTDEEKKAATAYSGGSHQSINRALDRGGEMSSENAARSARLDALISRSSIPEDMVVLRGIRGRDAMEDYSKLKPGDVFSRKGFTSTTAAEVVPREFQGDVEMRISLHRGDKAAPIPALKSGERELLLPRDQQLRLTSSHYDEGSKRLVMHVSTVPESAGAELSASNAMHDARAAERASAEPAADDLFGKLQGTAAKIDEGQTIGRIGAESPARAEYVGAKAEGTAAAAKHFRAKATGGDLDPFFSALTAPKTRDAYVAQNIGRAMREEGSHAAALAKVEREWAGRPGAARPAEGHPLDVKRLELAHDAAIERAATAADPAERAAAAQEAQQIEKQITQVGARPGAVEDVAAIAPALTRVEKAAAALTEALGDAAPAAAREHAAAFRAAEDEATRKTTTRIGQAADDAATGRAAAQNRDPLAPPARPADDLLLGPSQKQQRIGAAQKAQREAGAAYAKARVAEAEAKIGAKQTAGAAAAERAKLGPPPEASSPPAGAGIGHRVVQGAHVVGFAADLASDVGIPGVPRPHDIPVIGPMLSAYLKYRALRAAAGRFMGRVPATAETQAAALAARTRDGIARAVDRSLGLVERNVNAVRAALTVGTLKATDALSKRLVDDGAPDAPAKASVSEQAAVRMREVAAVAANPALIHDAIRAQGRALTDPDLIDALSGHLVAMFQRLSEVAPKGPPPNPFTGKTWTPSPAEAIRFGQQVAIARDPQVAFQMLEAGTLTPAGADTLRKCYALLFRDGQARVIQRATDLKNPVDYSQLIRLGRLFDMSLHPSQDPANAAVLAGAHTPAAKPAPAAGSGGGPPTPSIAGPTTLSNLYQPSGERAQR